MHLRSSLVLFLCLPTVACGSSGSSSPTPDAGSAGHQLASGAGHAGGGGAGAGSSADAGSTDVMQGATALTGTLGALGEAKATVSSYVITNGREVLVYMSSEMLTCDQIKASRWLGSIAAGTQVVEIVVPAAKTAGTLMVGQGAEINYAEGGKSSSYEKGASTGSVTFTSFAPSGVAEGSLTATYKNPTGNVAGTFHAEFCEGAQEF